MRALTLTQPWAWLVVHGRKDIENRKWNTSFRGEFLIHAAKGMRKADYEAAQDLAAGILGYQFAQVMPLPEQLERGGIVGLAELYDVTAPLSEREKQLRMVDWCNRGLAPDPWHFHDQYGFRLKNVQALPFLPCKGALGFWGNFEIRDGQAVQL